MSLTKVASEDSSKQNSSEILDDFVEACAGSEIKTSHLPPIDGEISVMEEGGSHILSFKTKNELTNLPADSQEGRHVCLYREDEQPFKICQIAIIRYDGKSKIIKNFAGNCQMEIWLKRKGADHRAKTHEITFRDGRTDGALEIVSNNSMPTPYRYPTERKFIYSYRAARLPEFEVAQIVIKDNNGERFNSERPFEMSDVDETTNHLHHEHGLEGLVFRIWSIRQVRREELR